MTTAVLEWARIAEFRAEDSPVETVRRRLPKRAGGPKHHDAVHWSEVDNALARIDTGQCMPSTKRAIRFTALTAARQVEVRRARVGPTGAKSWIQRLVIDGRRRDIGLGGFPLVTLVLLQ